MNTEETGEVDDEDEIGGLFKVLKEKSEAKVSDRAAINTKDCSKCSKYSFTQFDVDKVGFESILGVFPNFIYSNLL